MIDQKSHLAREMLDNIHTMQSTSVAEAVEILKRLSDDQRIEVMSEFCGYCGCHDAACQCSNDE